VNLLQGASDVLEFALRSRSKSQSSSGNCAAPARRCAVPASRSPEQMRGVYSLVRCTSNVAGTEDPSQARSAATYLFFQGHTCFCYYGCKWWTDKVLLHAPPPTFCRSYAALYQRSVALGLPMSVVEVLGYFTPPSASQPKPDKSRAVLQKKIERCIYSLPASLSLIMHICMASVCLHGSNC
jgi:hypothetical protein